MKGRGIKLYQSHDQSPTIPPGYEKAAPKEWGRLTRLSAALRHDWYELIWMPGQILMSRHFSTFVLFKAAMQPSEPKEAAESDSGFSFPSSYMPSTRAAGTK